MLRSSAKAFDEVSLDEANRVSTDNGRYQYERRLGCGTFGSTFLATDRSGSRQVVVKLVCPGGRYERGWGTMLHLQRLLHEAKALSELRHACIAPYENAFYYEMDTSLCIGAVTEFCSAGNLNDFLVEQRYIEEDKKVSFSRQLASGMEYLHAHGFTHRNIKPDNVLIGSFGAVKITEFGLAKLAWEVSGILGSSRQGGLSDYLTKSSLLSGVFMAPEAHDNLWVESGDVFSLGLVFVTLTDPRRFWQNCEGRSVILPQIMTGKGSEPLGKFLHSKAGNQDDATHLLGFPSDVSAGGSQVGVLLRVINKMLVADPARRISMMDARFTLERMDSSEPLCYPSGNEPVQMDSAWSCCCFQ